MEIHPLIVHFPIVCLILAPVFDWLSRLERLRTFEHTGLALLILGAVMTIPAAYTGESAAEIAGSIPGIQESLTHHEDLSTFSLWSSLLLAVARIHLVAKKRYDGLRRLGHTLLMTFCAGFVCWSAYTGGRLVYEFGAGTRPVVDHEHASPEATPYRKSD